MSDLPDVIAPQYSLYPYQRQVVYDLLDILLPGHRREGANRAVAHLPTGAGKTRIATHVACAMLNQAAAEGKVVFWLASSEELCDQAADALTTAWKCLGTREAAIHRFWGTVSTSLEHLHEGFVVAGLPKLWANASRHPGFLAPLANQVAGVIFDEAHQAVAPTYAFLTEQLAEYGAPLLGLTATPGRGAVIRDADYDLSEMFGDNKVGIDPAGHDTPVTYLIRNGYLAEPVFIEVEASSAPRLTEPASESDYREADLQSLGRDAAWRDLVVSLTRQALRRHQRVIVFCPSVSCALAAANILSQQGYNAPTIVADTSTDHRREIITAFKSNLKQPMALLNFGVLTAGFDAPNTSCVIVARPTRSLVLYSQMIGRAMRGPLSGGNRRSTIYTMVDRQQRGFASVADAFQNWEALWRAPQTN